jgi:hypothetical protein
MQKQVKPRFRCHELPLLVHVVSAEFLQSAAAILFNCVPKELQFLCRGREWLPLWTYVGRRVLRLRSQTLRLAF